MFPFAIYNIFIALTFEGLSGNDESLHLIQSLRGEVA